MGRAPCCDKANVKRGPWSPEEDTKLKSYIEQHGTGGNWIALPQKIGLKRCGKSCRLRWLNYLRPNLKHGGFSEEEDNIIGSLYITIGSRWSIIAARLPGRTDNDIKNYWNTSLKKKLLGKQRKDHQHGRRSGGVKQEGKAIENVGQPIPIDDGRNWPVPSLPMYPFPISHADHLVDDEQESIKKLLIKLGGVFSGDGTSNRSPTAVPQHLLYDDHAMMVPSTTSASIAPFMDSLQCPAGFQTELDEIFPCNTVKLEGLDCLFGEGTIVDDGDMPSSSSQSAIWSEVSPLIYPQSVPSYQQQYMFEDQLQQ